jgi:hypothetical protein
MNRNQCRFLGAVALLLPGCTGSLPVPPLRVDEPTRLAPPPPPPGMPGTAADAYEDDLYGAANRALPVLSDRDLPGVSFFGNGSCCPERGRRSLQREIPPRSPPLRCASTFSSSPMPGVRRDDTSISGDRNFKLD